MEENRRGSRSGRTLRVRDDPGVRARSRRTILKSSSIEKNCLRSSSTWTCGVPRNKESLPNAKVQKPNSAEFPQILARGLELKGECDESGSHHHPQEVWSRCTVQLRAHICELCLPTERGNMVVVNLATKRTSTRCVCRLNAELTWTQERKSSSPCRCSNYFSLDATGCVSTLT